MSRSDAMAIEPSADQVMRRMLNTVTRLQATCAEDVAELRRLQDDQRAAVTSAQRDTRARVEKAVEGSGALADVYSLGGRLRADLNAVPIFTVQHLDPGSPPASFDDAVKEWKQLAPTCRRQVADLTGAYEAWSGQLIRRKKHAPAVPQDLWRALDRLDLIHRAIPSLREATVAAKIHEATSASDVVIAAERERQRAAQGRLAQDAKQVIASVHAGLGLASAAWSDERWGLPMPAVTVEHLVRVGELIADVPEELGVRTIPALVSFPFDAGIAVVSDVANRGRAIGLVKSLLLRLFAAVPAGGLHGKVIDPVSLGQSVAEFRHLAEYSSELVDEKTWTSERDIERVLDDLADHLEVVISKYLRGQFGTIDDYNAQAGEVAQPYRVLTVLDYPTGFSERASRQLLSLVENGPRCGVYTLLHANEQPGELATTVPLQRLMHGMQRIELRGEAARITLAEPVGEVALRFVPDDAPPISFDDDGRPETTFARLLPAVGQRVREQQERPPTVTLRSLLPVLGRSRTGVLPDFEDHGGPLGVDPSSWWHGHTRNKAVAPIGRSGAQDVASLHFSSTEVAGGAIVVGLPRSGKTTSLHAMILTMSMLYPPEELELYLIDAKHGVEFKMYEELPHARMVSVHSDREFSLAVLKSIEAKIQERAEVMKADGAGRANITEYREATGVKMPRIVVVVDEFHELFEEPDRLGQEAFAAFSNIVRMGPFSGVHMVVASQTLSSMPAMDRPTLLLLPQRVAFMCNEYDAEIVMGDTNRAPRLLTKTGEGLFNPARGEESKNQLFQGVFLDTKERTKLLADLAAKARDAGWTQRPRVFDGDAVVTRPPAARAARGESRRITIPIGEPFSLAEAESVVLRRTRGSNAVIVGGRDDDFGTDAAVQGALHSCLLAVRDQQLEVFVVDFLGDDEAAPGLSIMDAAETVGATYLRSRGAAKALDQLYSLVAQRTSDGDYKAPPVLLLLHGLQRARIFKPVDPYALDGEAEPSETVRLLAVLRDGPDVGVHVIVSTDRLATLEQKLGDDAQDEFALRIGGCRIDQRDVTLVAGDYGNHSPLRPGQLLIGSVHSGSVKRVRGYTVLSEGDLVEGSSG